MIPGAMRQKAWWMLVPAVVLVLSSWCQLQGTVMGRSPIPIDIALPWALQITVGWIVAGALLVLSGARLVADARGTRQRWTLRALLLAGVVTITLTSEAMLLSDGTRTSLWLYDRLPIHLLFATLLVGGYLLLQRREAIERVAAPVPAGVEGAAPTIVEVMTGTGRAVVRLDEIECLEADRNYINVHTQRRSYLLRQTLSSFEKSLHPQTFLRIHRSIIVNRAMIRERRRGGVLVLHSGRTVRVSRAFAHQLATSDHAAGCRRT